MRVKYAAVYRSTDPLVAFSPDGGEFESEFAKYYSKENTQEFQYFHADSFDYVIFHGIDDLNCFLIIYGMPKNYDISVYLKDIQSKFLSQYNEIWKSAKIYQLQSSFQPQLSQICQLMERFAQLNEENENSGLSEVDLSSNKELTLLQPSSGNRLNSEDKKVRKFVFIAIFVFLFALLSLILLTYFCGGFSYKKCRK